MLGAGLVASATADDGVVEAWFEEPGRCDDCAEDPYGATSPEAVLEWLQTARVSELA